MKLFSVAIYLSVVAVKAAEFSLKNNFNFQFMPLHIVAYRAPIVFNTHNEPQMLF